MKSEFKLPWINALRSGEYEQGQRALCCENHYCCLGVLSELIKDHPSLQEEVWVVEGGVGSWNHEYPDGTSYNNDDLPYEVRELVGLDIEHIDTLIMFNDRAEYSFVKIAGWVEENL